jgi:hypothetical protein
MVFFYDLYTSFSKSGKIDDPEVLLLFFIIIYKLIRPYSSVFCRFLTHQ